MKVVTVVGARPQFVKAAVLRRLFREGGINEILIHTGQHYDYNMSQVFFEELGIAPPEHFVELQGRSHGAMTGEILARTEVILEDEKPDLCLVYGDTNSTIAGALAAAKLGIPVCHVEAGLRSFDKNMPEEINRILTDNLSDILFCSTYASIQNLRKENITKNVYHVGDIMHDAVQMFTNPTADEALIADHTKEIEKPLAILTIHRQATVDSAERLTEVINYCRKMTDRYTVVFPSHPRTKKRIEEEWINLGDIRMIDPVPYLTMQALLSQSSLMLTDSGGMQKEAYFHRVRCITLRDETEWVETISSGWNRLWIHDDYDSEPREIEEYGAGDSGKKIFDILMKTYGDTVN